MKSVCLIGDSIRRGYQNCVFDQLNNAAAIWAPEENGGDSRNILRNLEKWVLCREPDILHLNFGLHDAKRASPDAPMEVPLDEYENNLVQIFQLIHERTQTTLIWATTTPVIEKDHLTVKGFCRANVDIDACNQVATSICIKFGVPVNDLHHSITAAGPSTLLTEDGVHYSDEGSTVLGIKVADFIRSFL